MIEGTSCDTGSTIYFPAHRIVWIERDFEIGETIILLDPDTIVRVTESAKTMSARASKALDGAYTNGN